MQSSATRLGAVLDALLAGWRTLLEPDGWVVVDGALSGATGPLVLEIGAGNEFNGDPYNVETSEHDLTGGHREDGVVRCQLAVVATDARDPRPAREVLLAAVGDLDASLRGDDAVLLGVADAGYVGSQRWWHVLSPESGTLIVAADVNVHWVAWI